VCYKSYEYDIDLINKLGHGCGNSLVNALQKMQKFSPAIFHDQNFIVQVFEIPKNWAKTLDLPALFSYFWHISKAHPSALFHKTKNLSIFLLVKSDFKNIECLSC